MRCPFCNSEDTQVKDSRQAEDGSAVRRRRLCGSCGGRFTTFERVQLRELTVVKKNNRRTPFDRDKLARSVLIAMQWPMFAMRLSIKTFARPKILRNLLLAKIWVMRTPQSLKSRTIHRREFA